MGAVQSKKKGAKAYASRHASSMVQSSSSTSASTHTQSSNSSNRKITLDDSYKKTSVYSVESVLRSSTPVPPTLSSHTTSNHTNTSKYNLSPPTNNIPTKEDLEEVEFYIEQSLYNVHESNSFYLPKDWDSQDYQYTVIYIYI